MRWLHAAMPIAFIFLAYVFGAWVGGKGRRAATWAIGLTLPLLLIRWLIRMNPGAASLFFPFKWYGLVHAWWAYPVAYFFLSVPTARWAGRITRGLVHICIMLITVSVGVRSAGEFRFNPNELTGRANEWGLCAQTGSYSCGAAAAATLVGLYELPATESEMAELCGTNPFLGTDPVSVQYGLRRKLAELGCDVQVRQCDWAELRRTAMPVMALVKYRGMVDHWVVLLDVDDRAVTVADSQFVAKFPSGMFAQEWRGLIVAVEGGQPWRLLRHNRAVRRNSSTTI